MRFLQINDVSQQLNVQGHWYLLDSQDYEITPARLNFPGMMRFQADGDARLSIIGSCGADYTLRRKRVPVVVGRCCSQTGTPKEKCFDGWASIFDAWGGSFGNITCPAVMKSDFAFSDVWFGFWGQAPDWRGLSPMRWGLFAIPQSCKSAQDAGKSVQQPKSLRKRTSLFKRKIIAWRNDLRMSA